MAKPLTNCFNRLSVDEDRRLKVCGLLKILEFWDIPIVLFDTTDGQNSTHLPMSFFIDNFELICFKDLIIIFKRL